MLSSASIQSIRDDATKASRRNQTAPRPISQLNLKHLPGGETIPFLGDFVHHGWRPALDIDGNQITFFVDSTGRGSEHEPALTQKRFAKRLAKFAKTGDNYAVGVIEAGEMQVVVGLYLPAVGDFTQSGKLTEQELKDALAGNRYGG